MNIRAVRDTFLHYVADNIGGGVDIHPVRTDPNNPGADGIKVNSINIQYLNIDLDLVGYQQVAIDILHTDENTAIDWMERLWTVLDASFMTTVYDYTVPTSPVAQSANLMWAKDAVKFRRIADDNYVRYSCLMRLNFRALS